MYVSLKSPNPRKAMFNFEEYTHPAPSYRGTDFWMLNDQLTDEGIEFQLAEMSRQGIGSFIARTYIGLKSDYPGPGFKKHIRTIVEGSRKYGLRVFIQAGYMPEAVLDLPEEFALRHIKVIPKDEAQGKGDILDVRGDHAFVEVNTLTFLDMFNAEAIKFYLKQSYEDMWAEFKDDFGGVIQSIWVDEPSYSSAGLPWGNSLIKAFREKWGYDIRDKVALLFMDEAGYEAVRCHYWLTLQDLLRASYFEQVHDWCVVNNIQFSGHLMMEDTLEMQLMRAGACMPYYKYFDIPGIDHLTAEMQWRYAPLPTRYGNLREGYYLTPLQCCSAANQAGQKKILAEMYGVSSENLAFRDQKNMFDHFAAFGINHKSVHGIFYSLRGRGKRAYPPHVHYYQPYWTEYKEFTDYCARVSYFISQGEPVKNILVVHPLTSAVTEHRGPGTPIGKSPEIRRRDNAFLELILRFLGNQIDFDLGDEQTLHCWGEVTTCEGKPALRVGKMTYHAVVLPELKTISPSTLELLATFVKAGGKLLILGQAPALLDGRPAPEIADVFRGATIHGNLGSVVRELTGIPKDYRFSCLQDALPIHINYRKDQRYQYFFIFNGDWKEARSCRLSLEGCKSAIILPGTDAPPMPVIRKQCDFGTEFAFDIPAGSSVMLLAEATQAPFTTDEALPQAIATTLELTPQWSLSRKHPNSLVLEFASFRKGDGDYSPVYPILAIHDMLTNEDYRGPLTLRFAFKSDIRLDNLKLALESPHDHVVSLNGVNIPVAVDGYFWDKSFETIPLTAPVLPGENVLEVSRQYMPLARFRSSITSLFENLPGVELECMYLVGDFGVWSSRLPTRTHCNKMDHRFALGTETDSFTGELVDAGYPFYTGTMSLTQTVTIPQSLAGKRASIKLEGLTSCLARIFVNGEDKGIIAWEPNELDIGVLQQGEVTIGLDITNTLRNLLGPYHRPKGEFGEAWGGYGYPNLPWIGAVDEVTRKPIPNWQDHRIPDTNAWTEDYMLVSNGLQGAYLIVRE